jgi:hypothetical protein
MKVASPREQRELKPYHDAYLQDLAAGLPTLSTAELVQRVRELRRATNPRPSSALRTRR